MSPEAVSASAHGLEARLAALRSLTDGALDAYLPQPEEDPGRLMESMRYAVLQGGKRMRPVLTLAACEAGGGEAQRALPAACALELIHAYSLVHDDLPAMDDDEMRRGRPTVHVAYGQATAILCGDALLTRAFEILGDAERLPAAARAACVGLLARHAGAQGMVGGQVLDLEQGQAIRSLDLLERVHALKTGALYAAAGAMGGLAAGLGAEQVGALERAGLCFGIAFQHADDALDDEQIELRPAALARVDELVAELEGHLAPFGASAALFRDLGRWVRDRAHRAAAGHKEE